MTQQDQVRDYIDRHGSITPMQAFSDLGITKLATVVSDMRKNGYKVKIDRVKGINRLGHHVSYAIYIREEQE